MLLLCIELQKKYFFFLQCRLVCLFLPHPTPLPPFKSSSRVGGRGEKPLTEFRRFPIFLTPPTLSPVLLLLYSHPQMANLDWINRVQKIAATIETKFTPFCFSMRNGKNTLKGWSSEVGQSLFFLLLKLKLTNSNL